MKIFQDMEIYKDMKTFVSYMKIRDSDLIF